MPRTSDIHYALHSSLSLVIGHFDPILKTEVNIDRIKIRLKRGKTEVMETDINSLR